MREANSCREIETNMERKAMLQSRLHNTMRSLPQHTYAKNSKSCHSSSLHLSLLEQVSTEGGTQLLLFFIIKAWQYLISCSNKSVIIACFSFALLKKKYQPICLPVFQRMFFHWCSSAQIFSCWNSSACLLFFSLTFFTTHVVSHFHTWVLHCTITT